MSDLVRAVERMVELAEETLASELPDGEARAKVAALARVGREALGPTSGVDPLFEKRWVTMGPALEMGMGQIASVTVVATGDVELTEHDELHAVSLVKLACMRMRQEWRAAHAGVGADDG